MSLQNHHRLLSFGQRTTAKFIIYFIILIVISNLNAIVDAILHPDIPYFDKEHLIVGGVTGLVSIFFFWLLIIYQRYLDNAINKIQILEKILSICAYCKRIRKPDSDPRKEESWQQLEAYITETTTTEFSHGICPDCYTKLQMELNPEEPIKPERKSAK